MSMKHHNNANPNLPPLSVRIKPNSPKSEPPSVVQARKKKKKKSLVTIIRAKLVALITLSTIVTHLIIIIRNNVHWFLGGRSSSSSQESGECRPFRLSNSSLVGHQSRGDWLGSRTCAPLSKRDAGLCFFGICILFYLQHMSRCT